MFLRFGQNLTKASELGYGPKQDRRIVEQELTTDKNNQLTMIVETMIASNEQAQQNWISVHK